MPQMSPLPWLMLMMMFIFTLMLFSSQISSTKSTLNPKSDSSKATKTLNWKW